LAFHVVVRMMGRGRIFLKVVLGLFCLALGSSLLCWEVASVAREWETMKHGMPLLNLFGLGLALVGMGASADLLRRSRIAEPEKEGIAKSIWAGLDHLNGIIEETTPTKDRGIYLGTFESGPGAARLRYSGEKNLLCFGPPRSGKSASIIVPNLQNLRRTIIVCDPKGELAAITEKHRATFGKTIVLNPFGVLTDTRPRLESVGWNPLLQLDTQSRDFAGDALCIADAIVEKSAGGGSSEFFDRSAKNLVQALVMWERLQNGRKATLRNIPKMLTGRTDGQRAKESQGGFLPTLEGMAKCKNDVVENIAARLLERLNDKNSQSTAIQDVIETLLSHFAFVNNDNIADDMERGGAIDFAALHREVTTIYLILPPRELSDNAKWLRLFVNLALRKLYGSAPSEEAPPTLPPVLFMLDEFGNLGRLQEIVKALNMAAFARIQLMFFLQNIGQLNHAYKDEVGSFFSGAGATTTFKTGAMDTETAEHLAKAFGNQEMYVQTETRGGVSLTPQPVPLIRAEDIARLRPRETISVIEPCGWPVRASAPVYAHMPYFNEGLDRSPFFHG
jgi:type IV secretory pathway TraG/TraD family ATPase VirD4